MIRNATKQDEQIQTLSNLQILLRLLKYMIPYKYQVTIVIFYMICEMAVGLANPYLLKVSIDRYVVKADLQSLLLLGGMMVLINIAVLWVSKVRIVSMASISNEILVQIRQELYSHIQKLTFSFFDHRPVGKVLARVIGDVNSLQKLFSDGVTNFIPQLLTLLCVAVIMFSMNIKLAFASMTILPILAAVMFYIQTVSRIRWQNYRKKRSNLNGFTHEDFSGMRVVQGFGVEEMTARAFNEYVKELMKAFVGAIRLNNFFWPLVEVSWGVGMVVVYGVSMKLIIHQEITLGVLVAFTWYIGMFWRPIMNISNFYNTLITNFAAAERIFEILDIQPEIISKENAVKISSIKGNVEFKNVSFGYGQTLVLRDVSFTIHAGETIALVGPTGAGKTTIINLISRFYDARYGEVLIDGTNIQELELEAFRCQLGMMLQDTFLFSTTVMENIRYGRLDASDEEVIEAAQAVHAHEFISKLEKGYQTEVSERGSRLSVGQRQLISFARALLANPRILILDEATSNIDTFTEQYVQKGLSRILHGRTSFVIAHRLSTIRNADRIFVIDQGQIVEEGTHQELMARKNHYYNLYMAQYQFMNEGA